MPFLGPDGRWYETYDPVTGTYGSLIVDVGNTPVHDPRGGIHTEDLQFQSRLPAPTGGIPIQPHQAPAAPTPQGWLTSRYVANTEPLLGPPGPGEVAPAAQSQSQREQTLSGADGPLAIVYGPNQVGARLLDVRVKDGKLYVVAGVACGPIEDIVTCTFAREDPGLVSHIFEKNLGLTGASAAGSSLLLPVYMSQVGYNPKRPGKAYGAFEFPTEATGFEGIPEMRFYVKGRKDVVDPRENLLLTSEDASSWALDSGSAPTLTTGRTNLWGEMKAWKWDCTGGSATLRRTTGSTTVSNGTAVTFSFWAKLISGSGAVTATIDRGAGVDDESSSLTLKTQWKRFTVSHSTTWSGTGQPRILLEFPSGCVADVFGPQLERRDEAYGYVRTTSAEITERTQYTDNPALCTRHFLMDTVAGARMSADELDDASWTEAAHLCEVQRNGDNRFRMAVAFSGQTDARTVLKAMLLCFQAAVYWQEEKLAVFVDVEQEDVVLDFDEDTNAQNVQVWRERRDDSPSRVIVQYTNAASDWITDQATSEDPGVSDGSVEVVEAVYQTACVSSATYATRLAEYLRKFSTSTDLRVSFLASVEAVTLRPGQLITLTAKNGLSARTCIATDIERINALNYRVSGRAYDADLYAEENTASEDPPPESGTGGDVSYLDAWFGWAGSAYPYNGSSPADYTVSADETWDDSGGDPSIAYGGKGFRRFKKLTINAGKIITIQTFPFTIFADEIAFGSASSQIKADGESGAVGMPTFHTRQARGGRKNSTSKQQGGCGGGLLFVVCNTISTAAGLITANGGDGYSNADTTNTHYMGGQGCLSQHNEAEVDGAPEDWSGNATTLGLPWGLLLGNGGGATSTLIAKAGGSGCHDTTADRAGGGSGVGAGGGAQSAGSPLVLPRPIHLLELWKLGGFGGGGGGAYSDAGSAHGAGGGGGGAIVVWVRNLSTTPTLEVSGGVGAGGGNAGSDGVGYLIVW